MYSLSRICYGIRIHKRQAVQQELSRKMYLTKAIAYLLASLTPFVSFSSPMKLNNNFLNRSGELDGIYPTASDISSDGKYLFIVGYGKKSCEDKGDGLMVFDISDASKITKAASHCGLYFKPSAEALSILSESPYRLLVSAEGWNTAKICEFDPLSQDLSCDDEIYIDDFKSGKKMQENSGIDVARKDQIPLRKGDLWVMPDSSDKLWIYDEDCYKNGECGAKFKLKLPKYLNQAEDICINPCPEDNSKQCTYIADIGAGGSDKLYTISHDKLATLIEAKDQDEIKLSEWNEYNLRDLGKQTKDDSESFSTIVYKGEVYAVITYKNQKGLIETFKIIPKK